MKPSLSARNLTPSSLAPADESAGTAGVVRSLHRLHGQTRRIVTEMPADGISVLPLSSTARLLRTAVPLAAGVQVNVQLSRPVAGCQVAPLSKLTSTAATTPPPPSVAVPLMTTGVPASSSAPDAGARITEPGFVVSVEGVP